MKRHSIGKAVAIAVAVVIALLTGASHYMLYYSLESCPKQTDNEGKWNRMVEDHPWMKQWHDSIVQHQALHDTMVMNGQHQQICVYWMKAPHPTSRTAVLLHGYSGCAVDMMQIAYMYHHDLGCNIICYDQYAHGHSDGKTIQMGWKDRHNAMLCARMADSLMGQGQQIVVHGISMGAATAMMMSGEERLPEGVAAFVEDCGYTSVWDEFSLELKKQFSLPEFPLMYTASMLCKLRNGWSFGEASSLRQVARCSKPMLFIHGGNDNYVPTSMVYPLHEAHHGPKALWIAPGSAHAQSYRDHHEEYTRQVARFMSDNGL